MLVKVVAYGKGEQFLIDLREGEEEMRLMTLQKLKSKIAKEILPKYPDFDYVCFEEFYFNGKLLEGDAILLSHHGIQHSSTVEVTAGIFQFQCARDPLKPPPSAEEKQEDKKRLSLECLADFVEPCGSSGGRDVDN